jgi:hypothetical protein
MNNPGYTGRRLGREAVSTFPLAASPSPGDMPLLPGNSFRTRGGLPAPHAPPRACATRRHRRLEPIAATVSPPKPGVSHDSRSRPGDHAARGLFCGQFSARLF